MYVYIYIELYEEYGSMILVIIQAPTVLSFHDQRCGSTSWVARLISNCSPTSVPSLVVKARACSNHGEACVIHRHLLVEEGMDHEPVKYTGLQHYQYHVEAS